MKYLFRVSFFITLLFSITTSSFGQIYMDGDSSDWEQYPLLIEAPNNEEGMFPREVLASVSDIVDIKNVKVTIINNILYGYIEFWGAPVWPNNAYENEHDGILYYGAKGYYNLILDIDNDATTGWSTDWYEAHYTTLGYLMTTTLGLETIGGEVMYRWHARMRDDWEIANEGASAVERLYYEGINCEEYDGRRGHGGGGSDYDVFYSEIPNPDSAKVMKWEGSWKIDDSDDELLMKDSLSMYWSGHAWGYNFLEFGIELTPFQKHFMNKDGRNVLQPGDVIGLCGMVETPIDDWGSDMTTRGEISIVVGVSDNEPEIIKNYNLSQNYPNPFNSSTMIKYDIANSVDVSLTVYDVLGNEITKLINKRQSAGSYSINWDAGSLSSGIYFYRLEVTSPELKKEIVFSKKMILLK